MQLFKPSERTLLVLDRTRDSNRSRVVCDCSYERLFDPPDGVGGKFVSTSEVKLLHGSDKPDIALLDEIDECNASISKIFGADNDEPKIVLDKAILGIC